jgi:hypothetical protein
MAIAIYVPEWQARISVQLVETKAIPPPELIFNGRQMPSVRQRENESALNCSFDS